MYIHFLAFVCIASLEGKTEIETVFLWSNLSYRPILCPLRVYIILLLNGKVKWVFLMVCTTGGTIETVSCFVLGFMWLLSEVYCSVSFAFLPSSLRVLGKYIFQRFVLKFLRKASHTHSFSCVISYKSSCPFLHLFKFILKKYTTEVPTWATVLQDWTPPPLSADPSTSCGHVDNLHLRNP